RARARRPAARGAGTRAARRSGPLARDRGNDSHGVDSRRRSHGAAPAATARRAQRALLRAGAARAGRSGEVSAPPRRRLRPGMVSIVGAGPGDPDLLTVAAVKRLRRATLVLYDALVSP